MMKKIGTAERGRGGISRLHFIGRPSASLPDRCQFLAVVCALSECSGAVRICGTSLIFARRWRAQETNGWGTILATFPSGMNREIVDALLTGMLQSGDGVSDLLFVAGKPPLVETHGRLQAFPIDLPEGVSTPLLIEQIANLIINGNERLQSDLENAGSCDCSYALEDVARLRVNIYRQSGTHGIVMRKLQSEIPTLEHLNLPPIFREIVKENNGIVLVTGGAGTGKTSTLAAILNEVNETQKIHILTLEDPIEFSHPHQLAAVSQRELGKDFLISPTAYARRCGRRRKLILVGEIRDRETMEIAMTAAETGHVVFSTLHTINAGQTMNRVLGMFSREEEPQLRQRLAETLRYVVSQRLVAKVGGGRLMVSEIMGNSLRTRETILYGESEGKSFQDIIEAGSTARLAFLRSIAAQSLPGWTGDRGNGPALLHE